MFYCTFPFIWNFFCYYILLTVRMNNLSRRKKWGEKCPEKRRVAKQRVSVGTETCVHPAQSRLARQRLLQLQPADQPKRRAAAKVERRGASCSFVAVAKFFKACGVTSQHQNMHPNVLYRESTLYTRIPISNSMAMAVHTLLPFTGPLTVIVSVNKAPLYLFWLEASQKGTLVL